MTDNAELCPFHCRCQEAAAEIERLRAALNEAADDIAAWGAYAGDYFQEKHDLAGCVTRYRVLAGGRSGTGRAVFLVP